MKESDYVVILDAPNVPLWRSKPKKKLLVLLTGLFGIGLGLVLALIRDYMLNIDEEKAEKNHNCKDYNYKKRSRISTRIFEYCT